MTSGLKVSRDQHANRFTVNLPHRPPRSVVNELPFMTTDSLLSLRMLQDTISRNIGYSGTHPEFYGRWQELPGLPIDTLYRLMMYESDNFIAEQVLWMSSMRTLQRFNTADIIQHLKGGKMFGLPQPVEWHDGSGLSRFNMITPQSMCGVLNRMYREQSRSRLFSLFPTGGTGTLEGRYSSLRGQIFAKTGTLRNNVALSGYLLLPNGNPIIFSVLVSNHNTRPSIVRSAVEDYLLAARKLLSDQVR
jgi:D-alanyl-D-alanine carboxypeptidase/D-alanyl-D-alanine-endopeptidase (penicillin-binding protein 4)